MTTGLTEQEIRDIGAVCPRLYAAVGWSKGVVPKWDEFRSCCHPQAALVPMGSGAASPIPLETFIASMEEQRSSGAVSELSEHELSNAVQGFGNLANVRSTFSATINGAERRGVTYALLVRDQGRWMIISAAWENEGENRPLPDEFA